MITVLSLFASTAMAQGTLDCQISENSVQVEVKNLKDCNDLKTGTVCDFREGQDVFTAYAFDRNELANAKPGDSIRGYQLDGYVYTSWVVDSEQEMQCHLSLEK